MRGSRSERFWSKVNKTESCWLWTGTRNSKGYGRFRDNDRMIVAHRIAWDLAGRGPIPAGMQLCHVCDVRACVNPEHLFLGTQSDNMRDCVKKGRHVPNPARGTPKATTTTLGPQLPATSTAESLIRAGFSTMGDSTATRGTQRTRPGGHGNPASRASRGSSRC